MTKRKVENQITNLTPDYKKLGINPIKWSTKSMRHTFGKLSTITTTLF
jgi:hypothetical protein